MVSAGHEAAKAPDAGRLDGKRPIHVWLVHGTFEPDAPWTDPDRSALCRALEGIGADIEFHRHRWSGKNRQSDRVQAGHILRERILAKRAHDPNAALYVIGHSHGGTVVTHALRDSPALGHALDGVVFLSTPFIQLVPRVHAVAIGAAAILALALAGVPLAAVFEDEALLAEIGVSSTLHDAIRWGVFVTVAVGAVLWEWRFKEFRFEPWLRARLAAVQDEFAVEHLVPEKTLIIRAQADEASLGLTFVHALSRVLGELVGRLAAALTWLVPILRDRRERPTQAASGGWWRRNGAVVPFWTALVLMLTLGVMAGLHQAFEWVAGVTGYSLRAFPWASGVFARWDAVATWFESHRLSILMAVWAVGLAATLLLLSVSVIFAVLGRAFGRWFFLPGLFLEIFVEATPPGRWTLLQLAAPSQADAYVAGRNVSLTHSLSHSDPAAHEALVVWITATRGKRARRPLESGSKR